MDACVVYVICIHLPLRHFHWWINIYVARKWNDNAIYIRTQKERKKEIIFALSKHWNMQGSSVRLLCDILFRGRHSIHPNLFPFLSVLRRRFEIWILIGIVLIVFTLFYSTLGRWAEHLNDNKKSKPQNNDSKRRRCHPIGKDNNTMRISGRRNNGQTEHRIPVSRFLIQCYQLSLGLAVTKPPRSTSTRY